MIIILFFGNYPHELSNFSKNIQFFFRNLFRVYKVFPLPIIHLTLLKLRRDIMLKLLFYRTFKLSHAIEIIH